MSKANFLETVLSYGSLGEESCEVTFQACLYLLDTPESNFFTENTYLGYAYGSDNKPSPPFFYQFKDEYPVGEFETLYGAAEALKKEADRRFNGGQG